MRNYWRDSEQMTCLLYNYEKITEEIMNNESFMDLLPFTADVNRQGKLTIAGHSVPALTEKFGMPLYLYDAKTVNRQIESLQTALKANYPEESAVAYAAKAYLSLRFAEKLAQTGAELDAVSLNEMQLAVMGGFSPGLIHLHGNNKSVEEIAFAIDRHICSIVADNEQELLLINQIAQSKQLKVPVWLRITPDLHVDTHAHIETSAADSKFGFHIENGDAERGIRLALSLPNLNLTGLHCHLGSQLFKQEPYETAIRRIFSVSASCSFAPKVFSPGGGLGERYLPGFPRGSASEWIAAVTRTIMASCRQYGIPLPRIVVESGRWIVARAGIAAYKIGFQKVLPNGDHILSIDGGLADNPRKALYNADYSACIANKMAEPSAINYRVVGKYCETGDILIQSAALPKAEFNDILAVPVSGAYQLSMASNYNMASRPAVLWLEAGKEAEILQKRESLLDSGWWL